MQKEVKAAMAAGMSREVMVAKLRFQQHVHLRHHARIKVFSETPYHLYATGKVLFPYP